MAPNKKRIVPKRKAGPARARIPRAPILDAPAVAYAKLLADPCNGPLVHGLSVDGVGGIVSRFESDFIINGNNETAAFYAFVPGLAVGQGSTNLLASDATPITFGPLNNVFAFLAPSSRSVGSFRCLSACIQVYWPGTELNRAGVVGLMQSNYGDINDFATPVTPGFLRSASTYVERTPQDKLELKWTPSEADLNWTEQGANDTGIASSYAKRSTLTVSAAGLPANTGLRVRLTAVYEWKPLQVTGIAMQRTVARSNNTLSHVLNVLDSTGDWVYNGAVKVGTTLSKIWAAVEAAGGVAYGAAKMAARIMG